MKKQCQPQYGTHRKGKYDDRCTVRFLLTCHQFMKGVCGTAKWHNSQGENRLNLLPIRRRSNIQEFFCHSNINFSLYNFNQKGMVFVLLVSFADLWQLKVRRSDKCTDPGQRGAEVSSMCMWLRYHTSLPVKSSPFLGVRAQKR